MDVDVQLQEVREQDGKTYAGIRVKCRYQAFRAYFENDDRDITKDFDRAMKHCNRFRLNISKIGKSLVDNESLGLSGNVILLD